MKSKSRPMRRKGRLSLLPTLAMDILFEVFVRLQPLDILNIMYTSKGFRDLLIAPSSIFIWKTVRMNVEGFPDCPPFLSEFEYAKLAFSHFCYRCGKRTPNSPQWEVLARLCTTCLNAVATSPYHSYCPASYVDILGVVQLKEQNRFRKSSYYCEPQVRRLLKHIRNLPEKSSETWIADARRNAPGVIKHAKLCRDWEDRFRERRQGERAEIKVKRREDIHQRLTQLGFGPALSHHDAKFANHRLVKPAVGLTERIWNNIKAELIGWIQETETKYLAQSTLKAFTISHPDIILPKIADFLASRDLQRILGNLGDVPVSEGTFADMEVFMENWRKSAALQLADLVLLPEEPYTPRSRLRGRTANTATLAKIELATTVFSCKCKRRVRKDAPLDEARQVYMHYPWVMAHPCTYEDDPESVWSVKDLRYEEKASNTFVKPIIEACGLPPETTRTSDMDTLDPRLICLKCKHGNANPIENIVVYTWRSAIGHSLICPNKKGGYSWHRLSDEATKKVKETESTILGKRVVDDEAREAGIPQWGCTQCRDRRWRNIDTIEGIKSHIKQTHQGSEPAYYRLARCPPGMFEVTLPADQCDE
ncbi:hypothetical protein BD410DRAFT_96947 [Rickenella mellea]|uniref:F-box domain-containing protein n=1 Tax=Rickenella mellea TaxID=50990 RepID=A0A4Y7QC12_9AGAM|nr:hypothetical protein BD410DRAFT_96947 [Rickenella mellea]